MVEAFLGIMFEMLKEGDNQEKTNGATNREEEKERERFERKNHR